MTQISAPKITAPPNGTMAYVAEVLGGIASGSSRPDGFERYYGTAGAKQLYAAFQAIDLLLVQLCNAGVGSGREVWAAFTDGKVDEAAPPHEQDTDDEVIRVQQVLEANGMTGGGRKELRRLAEEIVRELHRQPWPSDHAVAHFKAAYRSCRNADTDLADSEVRDCLREAFLGDALVFSAIGVAREWDRARNKVDARVEYSLRELRELVAEAGLL